MKDTHDSLLLHRLNKRISLFSVRQEEIVHVVGVLAFFGNVGLLNAIFLCPFPQIIMIAMPDRSSLFLNRLTSFQLRIEEGRQQVRRKEARSDIDPGIFVNQSLEKPLSIRAFFPKDFGSIDKPRFVDNECATLATEKVFRLVKALCGQ